VLGLSRVLQSDCMRQIWVGTVKVHVVRAALDEGSAADALGRLCAVAHLHGQLRGRPVSNDQHPPLHRLPLCVQQRPDIIDSRTKVPFTVSPPWRSNRELTSQTRSCSRAVFAAVCPQMHYCLYERTCRQRQDTHWHWMTRSGADAEGKAGAGRAHLC
jgi:hypothetical protein